MSDSFKVIQGYHSAEMKQWVQAAWDTQSLLVLVPPGFKEFDRYADTLRQLERFPEPPVYGLFTSGTEGHKLIFYSRRNIEASLKGIVSFFDTNRIDSVFCYPQPYHVFGLVLGYLLPLIHQKRLVTEPGPYSRAAHDGWMESVGPGTLTLGTPTHFQDLIGFVAEKGITPRASYASIAGGAAVTRQLWRSMRDLLKIEAPSIGYGASELSPGATHLPPGIEPKEDGEIGFALPNLGLELHPGAGLRAWGENVCVAMASPTEIQFPKEVWLRDEVLRRDDGVLVFSNRTDLLLNRGGEKFSLEQIESLVSERFGVAIVATSIPHGRLGEELALIVQSPDADTHGLRDDIYSFLKTELGREFERDFYFSMPALPKNPNSKVDRTACRTYAEAQRAATA